MGQLTWSGFRSTGSRPRKPAPTVRLDSCPRKRHITEDFRLERFRLSAGTAPHGYNRAQRSSLRPARAGRCWARHEIAPAGTTEEVGIARSLNVCTP